VPTYEYECLACAHHLEAFQAMNDEALAECPRCGGALRRVPTAGGGVIVRGGATGAGGCALETTGRTCCGREARCGKPPCGGEGEG